MRRHSSFDVSDHKMFCESPHEVRGKADVVTPPTAALWVMTPGARVHWTKNIANLKDVVIDCRDDSVWVCGKREFWKGHVYALSLSDAVNHEISDWTALFWGSESDLYTVHYHDEDHVYLGGVRYGDRAIWCVSCCGHIQWSRDTFSSAVRDIKTDSEGNVYIVGERSSTNWNVRILDEDGNYLGVCDTLINANAIELVEEIERINGVNRTIVYGYIGGGRVWWSGCNRSIIKMRLCGLTADDREAMRQARLMPGEIVWKFDTLGTVYGLDYDSDTGMLYASGQRTTIAAGSDDHASVWKLDPSIDGPDALVWSVDLSGLTYDVAYNNGHVFACGVKNTTTNRNAWKVRVSDSEVVWWYNTESNLHGINVEDGYLTFAGYRATDPTHGVDASWWCFDASNPETPDIADVGAKAFDVAQGDGVFYVATSAESSFHANVWHFDPEGRPLWAFDLGTNAVAYGLLLDNTMLNRIYVCGNEWTLLVDGDEEETTGEFARLDADSCPAHTVKWLGQSYHHSVVYDLQIHDSVWFAASGAASINGGNGKVFMVNHWGNTGHTLGAPSNSGRICSGHVGSADSCDDWSSYFVSGRQYGEGWSTNDPLRCVYGQWHECPDSDETEITWAASTPSFDVFRCGYFTAWTVTKRDTIDEVTAAAWKVHFTGGAGIVQKHFDPGAGVNLYGCSKITEDDFYTCGAWNSTYKNANLMRVENESQAWSWVAEAHLRRVSYNPQSGRIAVIGDRTNKWSWDAS